MTRSSSKSSSPDVCAVSYALLFILIRNAAAFYLFNLSAYACAPHPRSLSATLAAASARTSPVLVMIVLMTCNNSPMPLPLLSNAPPMHQPIHIPILFSVSSPMAVFRSRVLGSPLSSSSSHLSRTYSPVASIMDQLSLHLPILLPRRSSSSSSTLPTAADHYYTLAVGTRRAVSPNAGQSSSRPSAASQSVLLFRRVVAAVPSMSMSMSFLSLPPILPSCVSCWYTRRLVYCHSPHPILQFPAYHLFTRTVLCFCVWKVPSLFGVAIYVCMSTVPVPVPVAVAVVASYELP